MEGGKDGGGESREGVRKELDNLVQTRTTGSLKKRRCPSCLFPGQGPIAPAIGLCQRWLNSRIRAGRGS